MSMRSPTAIHSVDVAMGLQTSPLSWHLIGSPDMPVSHFIQGLEATVYHFFVEASTQLSSCPLNNFRSNGVTFGVFSQVLLHPPSLHRAQGRQVSPLRRRSFF